jgi:predicted transcriptional regulator
MSNINQTASNQGLYMPKTKKLVNQDIHFKVLHILEENPKITQRDLAKKLGICHPGIYIIAISIKKQILQSTANLERKGT